MCFFQSLSPGLVKTEMPILMAHGGEAIFKVTPHIQVQDVANAVVYILGTPPNVEVFSLYQRDINFETRIFFVM